jgi:hypothetical protein
MTEKQAKPRIPMSDFANWKRRVVGRVRYRLFLHRVSEQDAGIVDDAKAFKVKLTYSWIPAAAIGCNLERVFSQLWHIDRGRFRKSRRNMLCCERFSVVGVGVGQSSKAN